MAGVYVGASIGQTDSGDQQVGSDNGGFVYTILQTEQYDTKDTGYSFFVGYEFEFEKHSLSIEGGWIDLGENTFHGTGYDVWNPAGSVVMDISAEATAITLSAVLSKKLNEDFDVYGRLGVSSWSVSQNFKVLNYDEFGALAWTSKWQDSSDDFDALFGIGVEYKGFRLGFDRYKINIFRCRLSVFGF